MFEIVEKESLNPTVTKMVVHAPLIARKARAGQFIILRAEAVGERIPLTVAGCDRDAGNVTVIFQVVGATTQKLQHLEVGMSLPDFVGPLGRPTELEGLKNVCVVGGGVGCAIALPVARALREQGARVTSIIGFRNRDLVILEEEFRSLSDAFFLMTDDGSYGREGNVCVPLRELLESGADFDRVIAIGPLIMMKFVCQETKNRVKTVVSMNPIMVDGTGMCGGCRLTVGGETKFACVDGPDFDGHLIDFDEAMSRANAYASFEQREREAACKLFEGVR